MKERPPPKPMNDPTITIGERTYRLPTISFRIAAFAADLLVLVLVALALPVPGATLLIYVLYHPLFIATLGATPGKAIFGMRVVRWSDGDRLSVAPAIGRSLLLYLVPLGPLIALLSALSDPLRRGWHDRWSGSIVITSG